MRGGAGRIGPVSIKVAAFDLHGTFTRSVHPRHRLFLDAWMEGAMYCCIGLAIGAGTVGLLA